MLAVRHGLRRVAFPAISCGVYGYPHAEAVRIALDSVRDFLGSHDGVTEVIFCCYNKEMADLYEAGLQTA